MAEASLNKVQVARPVVYDTVDEVNLRMSLSEAKFIAALMSRVGGNPENSMRKHADSIIDALSPVVGRRHFTNDCWFENGYDWDVRAHFSFGNDTDADDSTKEFQW